MMATTSAARKFRPVFSHRAASRRYCFTLAQNRPTRCRSSDGFWSIIRVAVRVDWVGITDAPRPDGPYADAAKDAAAKAYVGSA
jgi:hypothetical protein